MPNFATQVSVDAQNRRLTNTSLTGVRTPSTPQPNLSTIVPVSSILFPRALKEKQQTVKTEANQSKKYGAVPPIKINNVTVNDLQQTIPESEESDEEDDKRFFPLLELMLDMGFLKIWTWILYLDLLLWARALKLESGKAKDAKGMSGN